MSASPNGVGSWIEGRARISPEHTALLHGETRRTYRDLALRVARVSAALAQLGVRRGDRVVWLGANHPAFLEAFFATARIGAVFAPVNHRLERPVIEALVTDYSPTIAVIGPDAADVTLPSCVRRRVVVGDATGSGIDYEDLAARGADERVGPVDFDDVCLMPHTSGTTGPPKGVMLTHANVTWNVVNLLSLVDVRGDDVTIAIAPFFRSGGTGVNVLPVLFKGGTVVIPERPDPVGIIRLLEQHHVTIGFGNPDLLDALTRSSTWPTADLSGIRFIMTGGAPVPERLLRVYTDRGLPLLQGYGLSEAAPFVSLLDAESAPRMVGSAGKPPPLVELRTTRRDGADCAADETGELLVRGPNVMAGYWNRPVETARAIDEHGWLHTGDAARIDEAGYVWIVDRVADAYEAAGATVYPGDVERALGAHPGVGEVAVAASSGSSGSSGSSVAYVVRTADATADGAELLEFARARLDAHAVPSSVVFVDRLPRNSAGKVLRRELMDAAADESAP